MAYGVKENIFAVLYLSLNNGPGLTRCYKMAVFTLIKNNGEQILKIARHYL